MIVHFAATAHDVALALDERAIERTAGNHVLVEHVDALARHLRIAHEIERSGERRQSRADDVRALVLNALRLLRVRERLEIACRIVHGTSSPRARSREDLPAPTFGALVPIVRPFVQTERKVCS